MSSSARLPKAIHIQCFKRPHAYEYEACAVWVEELKTRALSVFPLELALFQPVAKGDGKAFFHRWYQAIGISLCNA